jgi:hypothetical protein
VSDRLPQLGAAVLTAAYIALAVIWLGREAPYEEVECSVAGPPDVRDAFVAGAEPAGFAVALLSAGLILWAGNLNRGDRIAVPVTLALGLLWWLTGTATPLWYWSLIALLGLAVSIFVVPILLVHISLNKGYEARRALRFYGWWSMALLAPAFVALVVGWESEPFC